MPFLVRSHVMGEWFRELVLSDVLMNSQSLYLERMELLTRFQGGLRIKKCLNSSFSFQLELLPLIRRGPWKCRNRGLFLPGLLFLLQSALTCPSSDFWRLLEMCWDCRKSLCLDHGVSITKSTMDSSVAPGLGSPTGIQIEPFLHPEAGLPFRHQDRLRYLV